MKIISLPSFARKKSLFPLSIDKQAQVARTTLAFKRLRCWNKTFGAFQHMLWFGSRRWRKCKPCSYNIDPQFADQVPTIIGVSSFLKASSTWPSVWFNGLKRAKRAAAPFLGNRWRISSGRMASLVHVPAVQGFPGSIQSLGFGPWGENG